MHDIWSSYHEPVFQSSLKGCHLFSQMLEQIYECFWLLIDDHQEKPLRSNMLNNASLFRESKIYKTYIQFYVFCKLFLNHCIQRKYMVNSWITFSKASLFHWESFICICEMWLIFISVAYSICKKCKQDFIMWKIS